MTIRYQGAAFAAALTLAIGVAACDSIILDPDVNASLQAPTEALTAASQTIDTELVYISFDTDTPHAGTLTPAQAAWQHPSSPPVWAHFAPTGLSIRRYWLDQTQGSLNFQGSIRHETLARDEVMLNGAIDKSLVQTFVGKLADHQILVFRTGPLAGGAAGRAFSDGTYMIDYSSAGIITRRDLVYLISHELGHNFIPFSGDGHIEPFTASSKVGFTLMAGQNNTRGDYTISAWERDRMGWINCVPISAGTHTLPTLLQGGCITVQGPLIGFVHEMWYVTYRRRGVLPWNTLEHVAATGSDHGLMTEGVLVMRTHRERGKIRPADGQAVLSSQAADYDGDLHGAGDTFRILGGWSVKVQSVSSAGAVLKITQLQP